MNKRNKQTQICPSYPENTDILDEYTRNGVDDVEVIDVPAIVKENIKRKRGQEEIFHEIIVE